MDGYKCYKYRNPFDRAHFDQIPSPGDGFEDVLAFLSFDSRTIYQNNTGEPNEPFLTKCLIFTAFGLNLILDYFKSDYFLY